MEINNRKEEDNEKLKQKNTNIPLVKRGFTWRPVPTILSTTLCFIITGVIFLIVGSILIYMTSQIKEFVIRYDNLSQCDTALRDTSSTPNKTCMIEINLEETFYPPVMVYFQLENFYQDHRRYIKSKSLQQLRGEILTVSQIKDDCDPITTWKDLGGRKTILGDYLNETQPANPCGLIAKSLFNDTYGFTKGSTPIFINETNIAWDSDKKGRFKNSPNWKEVQWTDVENEHFMVWMRPAGLPDFRKLWGRITTKLDPGTYKLYIENNYPVDSFGGKKSFVISTVNVLGGKNNFLGIAYLVVGCICLIMALLFWVGYKNYNTDKKLN